MLENIDVQFSKTRILLKIYLSTVLIVLIAFTPWQATGYGYHRRGDFIGFVSLFLLEWKHVELAWSMILFEILAITLTFMIIYLSIIMRNDDSVHP